MTANTDDTNFIPGELHVYEKYKFAKRHTFFGLMKLIGSILKIFADSDSEADFPYHWQGTFSEIEIHRDRLVLRQYKNFWIPITPFLKKYGRKTHVLLLKDVNTLVKNGENLFTIKFGGQEFEVPTQDDFNPEGLAYNLRIANPQIQFAAR